MTLVSEDGLQVLAAPAAGDVSRHGDRQGPRLEGPLRARADDGRAEADRGDVPFTDAPYAERHPSLAGAEAALVRVRAPRSGCTGPRPPSRTPR